MRRSRAERVELPTIAELTELAAPYGISHLGVASAAVLDRARSELLRRKSLGLHAGMEFTYRNPERSTDPVRSVAGARSLIVAARPYHADGEPATPVAAAGRVARYAWVDHYAPLREGLRSIARRLRASGERAVAFADDNSIVDREVAYLAGLGWFGKNANLLLPGAGSYFVLGSVVTTAEYTSGEPIGDGCGACQRCIPACPTAAIVAPGVIDARRCLAWLVQQPGTFPELYRVALGDRMYGCDDCQEACPPTIRFGGRHRVALEPTAMAWVDLLELLDADDEQLFARIGRWYLADRDPRWWRRNALVVLGNVGVIDDPRTLATLDRYRLDADPILAEHAIWALHRLADRRRVAASAVTP